MDFASISGAISGLTSAFELATVAIRARDDSKLAEAKELFTREMLKVNLAALQVQEKNAAVVQEKHALEQEVRELEKQIADLVQRKSDRDRYELREITEGAFVLAYKKADGDATPMHHLCQPCMDNKAQKSVLQRFTSAYGIVTLNCPTCEEKFDTGEIRP